MSGFLRVIVLVIALCAMSTALARASAAPDITLPPLGAGAILERARTAFHAHALPPYVVYTVSRRETVDGRPDFSNTYALRIWYRAADHGALARRLDRRLTRAFGPLRFLRVAFNADVDPGPPTADIFEPTESAAGDERDLPGTIAHVVTKFDFDYRATLLGVESGAYHLKLQALRETARNRLRELWVDRRTFEVRRMIADDRLYMGDTNVWYPDRLDATLARAGALPLIERISMACVRGQLDAPDERSDYRFEAVAFPATLPDWYFDPKTYGAHFAAAPVF